MAFRFSELEEAFFFFAYDKDRKISSKEVGAVVRSVGLNPTEGQLKEMTAEVDRCKYLFLNPESQCKQFLQD